MEIQAEVGRITFSDAYGHMYFWTLHWLKIAGCAFGNPIVCSRAVFNSHLALQPSSDSRRAALVAAAGTLIQLGILRLSFLQDGEAGVGVFPDRKEVLISGTSLLLFIGANVSAGKTELGE
jgi:hypothetical protein